MAEMKRSKYWYPQGTMKDLLPVKIDGATSAFPARVDTLMVPADDIPDEFCDGRSNKWVRIVDGWFFSGLDTTKFKAKEGIDPKYAWTHLSAIQRSFQPKHEYKTACVAYLMSLWFEEV